MLPVVVAGTPIPAKLLAVLGVVAAAAFLGGGYRLGHQGRDRRDTTFHDMRTLAPSELKGLVDADDPTVVELARRLRTPEEVYLYVRDRILFEPSRAAGFPAETLRDGAGSCLAKAALLASLYRALGMDDSEVRVVTGQVHWQDGPIEHAWLEIEHQGQCLQQDPTGLFGRFGFDEFKEASYTRAFVRRELFTFNDKGFAIISQRNRFR